MKRLFILLVSISILCSCTSKAVKYSPEYMMANYDKREVLIPMRDGVELFTAIYEPKNKSVQHPILVNRTPYGSYPYGEDQFDDFTLYAPYVDAEYIFVVQDVRGLFRSGGVFEHIRPYIEDKKVGEIDEASDMYDTVEWLVNNTNSNGCVGQLGISYNGFYATMGSLCGHPALKAVSPQAPVTDWFAGDDFHHNGVVMTGEGLSFGTWFEYSTPNDRYQNADKNKFPQLFNSDLYSDWLALGGFREYTEAYADSVAFLRTLREHPVWDEFWEERAVTHGHLHDVKPAILVVGGTYDKEDCYGMFETYRSYKQDSPSTDLFLVAGPWNHGAWHWGFSESWDNIYFGENATSTYYTNNIEYPFFAYYLEGKGEKPAYSALVYDSGKRQWDSYDKAWPSVSVAEATPYYFYGDGSLSTAPGTGMVSYISDPSDPVPFYGNPVSEVPIGYMLADQRFAAERGDVVCFETETLVEEVKMAGQIEVNLTVDISTTDADFIVKVIDVYPDDFTWEAELGFDPKMDPYPMGGFQQLVRGEVMRAKFRNSFSAPEPFIPGKATTVRYRMPDIDHTFKQGHKIMVQVQSTWFPLAERNPQFFCDTYTCDKSQYKKATVNIHCDGCSYVKLPVQKD